MANTLHIYGGTVTAGSTDGDLITDSRRLTLSGLRSGQPVVMYALRAESADYPAVRIKSYFSGKNAALFQISGDKVNWGDVLHTTYVAGRNVLFWIRCTIPEDMAYGIHSDTDLICDYLGGV